MQAAPRALLYDDPVTLSTPVCFSFSWSFMHFESPLHGHRKHSRLVLVSLSTQDSSLFWVTSISMGFEQSAIVLLAPQPHGLPSASAVRSQGHTLDLSLEFLHL